MFGETGFRVKELELRVVFQSFSRLRPFRSLGFRQGLLGGVGLLLTAFGLRVKETCILSVKPCASRTMNTYLSHPYGFWVYGILGLAFRI